MFDTTAVGEWDKYFMHCPSVCNNQFANACPWIAITAHTTSVLRCDGIDWYWERNVSYDGSPNWSGCVSASIAITAHSFAIPCYRGIRFEQQPLTHITPVHELHESSPQAIQFISAGVTYKFLRAKAWIVQSINKVTKLCALSKTVTSPRNVLHTHIAFRTHFHKLG